MWEQYLIGMVGETLKENRYNRDENAVAARTQTFGSAAEGAEWSHDIAEAMPAISSGNRKSTVPVLNG